MIVRNGGHQYEEFEKHLFKLNRLALQALGELEQDRIIVEKFFKERYSEESEKIWSVKKLYSLAMFIPMFLQIGLSYFSRVVYLDTHAGPGLAKIGPRDNEVIAGSPLIALEWPGIIATDLKRFQKIKQGFTEYIFIERDKEVYKILNRVVGEFSAHGNVKPILGDSNEVLPLLAKDMKCEGEALLLLFVDPFGKIESQLQHRALSSIWEADCRADIVMTLMSNPLARAFASYTSDIEKYRKTLQSLFGDFCEGNDAGLCNPDNLEIYPPSDLVVDTYKKYLNANGYTTVFSVPVETVGKRILYHLIFATRSPGGSRWMGNYIKWLERRLPKTDEIRGLFYEVTGRGLVSWF